MGRLKQLLPINDKPVILHCIGTIIASGIDDIVAVIRDDSNDLKEILHGLPLRIVFNRKAESEMAESVRIGLHEADASATGVMICPSDHPLVAAGTFKTLLHAHEQDPQQILIPEYNGKKGHPVIFPRKVIEDVFSGMNLREIISNNPDRVRRIPVPDEGVLYNMNTKEDYKNILKWF